MLCLCKVQFDRARYVLVVSLFWLCRVCLAVQDMFVYDVLSALVVSSQYLLYQICFVSVRCFASIKYVLFASDIFSCVRCFGGVTFVLAVSDMF